MKLILDQLAKRRIFHPLRKLGLAVAKHWPFPVRATLYNGAELWVDCRSAIGRAILVKAEFDQGVWRAIEPSLGAGGVFIDVGANVGYYTVLAGEHVGASGQAHAFEIDPRPLRCLRRNVAACKHHNISLHEIAIGDSVGEGVLQAESDCGHSSVHAIGPGLPVAVTSLDHWMQTRVALKRLDVIKIDIEGGELLALEGARKLIEKFRPVIVCEALEASDVKGHPGKEKLLRFFRSTGYTSMFLDDVFSPTILAAPSEPVS